LYARESKNVFSLDLEVAIELLPVAAIAREFQVARADYAAVGSAKWPVTVLIKA